MLLKTTDTVQEIQEKLYQELAAHDLYYGHGTDNAWDEANWLLASLTRHDGGTAVEEDFRLNERQIAEAEQIVRRRVQEKVPMAYLLGEAWFAGMPFYVDERVLVPRSPLAEVIENRFEPLLPEPPVRILDICCGSGCLGIAAAAAFPEARVDLSDISAGALIVAEKNIARHALGGRVRALRSDLFETIRDRYDLIIANPPYVSREEYHELPEEYLREPELGLVSEDEGLAIPSAILRQAAGFLTDRGCLILEVGHGWRRLDERYPDVPFLWLDFDRGGEGVCLLSRSQLEARDF